MVGLWARDRRCAHSRRRARFEFQTAGALAESLAGASADRSFFPLDCRHVFCRDLGARRLGTSWPGAFSDALTIGDG